MGDPRQVGLVSDAQRLLKQAAAGPAAATAASDGPRSDRAAQTVELARVLLALSEHHKTARDHEQASVLGRMMADPRGQVFTTLLTDRAYRSSSRKRTVEQARYLLTKLGPPTYLGAVEKLSLSALQRLGSWVPSLSGTAMLNQLRHETRAFILPAGEAELGAYLRLRRSQGIAVNVNHLGEEVLGEQEAARRLHDYEALLAQPDVETISVKVSSIFSQLQPLAFEASVQAIAQRLGPIYSAALKHRRASGEPKLVTLDMESYRDLELTLSAFMRVMDEPRFAELTAGVVLQAYLPDSETWHLRLLQWAGQRVKQGGAPLRIRLVKGANLAVERVESELKGWPSPVYPSKQEVDAQFKRLVQRACEPEHAACCWVGIGSHNLFDICFGLLEAHRQGVAARVAFELLEGMAGSMVLALRDLGANVLVYAPVVHEHEFPSAIAYLARRLDENTSPENYLGQSFAMQHGSPAWQAQQQRFEQALTLAATLVTEPRRTQDRSAAAARIDPNTDFQNEPDTDFSLSQNRDYIAHWLATVGAQTHHVTSSFGEGLATETVPGFDPSRPDHVPYTIALASAEAIEESLVRAVTSQYQSRRSSDQRRAWLAASAQALRAARGELIALMVLDSGKRVEEADVEVSEAVDFAEYYLRCQHSLEQETNAFMSPKGVVVVTPPWNFPLAIALGGVFAALVTGNAVIVKPALETPLVLQRACELLWQAGIPAELLQLAVCQDEVGAQLITDPRTAAVVLTGATSTARLFHALRPDLHLMAETGGKNALFVSAMADRELAIVDIVASAFGHSGQKCSALSQLILEREVYEDEAFLRNLKDAAESLRVGSAWELGSFITPLIAAPSELQHRALTQLLPGESWLLQPKFDAANPRLVSPGIKLGVEPGSWTHQTEFFCPLLAVLKARDVADAVRIANSTRYGLTAGIHSLDEREQEYFIEHIEAGNVYVNRKITGAIVRRQPFGGWKESGFGPGAKAGGPNYVMQFVEPVPLRPSQADALTQDANAGFDPELALPKPVDKLLFKLSDSIDVQAFQAIAQDYVRAYTQWFSSPIDESALRGEDNHLRYRPLTGLFVLADEDMQPLELAKIALSATVTGCPLHFYALPGSPAEALAVQLGGSLVDDAGLIEALEETPAQRVRTSCPLFGHALLVARQRNLHVLSGRLSESARAELLSTLREQSVSVSYHRYGHLGLRGLLH